MVFNATFDNISVIYWRFVFLVEDVIGIKAAPLIHFIHYVLGQLLVCISLTNGSA